MKSTIAKVRAALFGLAVASTLGFGTAQAFATPQPPEFARGCDDTRCNRLCVSNGYDWGYCSTSWSCTCEES
ncbi:MAG TPA: hypothetical protein VF615_07765 [Longimicrobiaceae bacterium]|jgi:hypothetical protein